MAGCYANFLEYTNTNFAMRTIFSIILFVVFVGCGSSGDKSSTTTAPSNTYAINLSFIRLTSANPNPFKVVATVTLNGSLKSGEASNLGVQLERGTMGGITEATTGVYEFTVTPTQTGEHAVTVSVGNTSVTRTPLVLQSVHSDWGQPQSVPGYANTAGYEDGVTITPDGEYLFVQTGPYRWASLLVFNDATDDGGCGGNRLTPSRCEHDWINQTTGTYSAPERPGFFDGRFSGTTQLHNAASWGVGVDGAPNLALSTMFYGFKKQSDGSFKEPFYMTFNDMNDAIVGPFGLSFRKNANGTSTIIFALKDAFTSGATFDVYTHTATLGSDINLGDYELSSVSNPPNRGAFFPSTLVDFGNNSGTQGNPFLYHTADGTIKSVWIDDEYDGSGDADYHKLSVYTLDSGTFPSSGTWTKTILPTPVNRGNEAIQPTFTGNSLFFTEDTNIANSTYSGTDTSADYATSGNWSTPVDIINKDTTAAAKCISNCSTHVGKIIAIGEPTIATVDGKQILYYVYAYVRGYDESSTGWFDLDFQAGFIEKN